MENEKLKKLSDYKDDIHRCSKCGLCQAVCPVYKTTGNECSVSRGQFIMLDGVVRGNLNLNKNINKYLDLCLKCNKCSEFCPSDIDVVDILLCAKHEYFKNSLSGKIYNLLESELFFGNILRALKFIGKLFNPKYKSKKFDKKVVYFGGCISAIRPNVKNYVTKLLNELETEVIDVDYDCCGMPFLTTGNLERFKKQIKNNILKIPNDVEYLVTDCASCEWAWNQYVKYIDDENLKDRLSKFKIISLYELIKDVNFVSRKHHKLTYHKPCHEKSDVESIIKSIENVDYVELEENDTCCGFAGLEHPQTLKTLYPVVKSKFDNLKKTKADIVITTCVGCLTLISLLAFKTRRLISFLMDNCEIKK